MKAEKSKFFPNQPFFPTESYGQLKSTNNHYKITPDRM